MSRPRTHQTEAIITKRWFIKGSAKGQSPFPQFLPLSFKGEGDTGGEVQLNKDKLGLGKVPKILKVKS
jgi:hypothetical protein